MNPGGGIEPEGIFDGLSGAAIGLGIALDIAATTLASALTLALIAPEFTSNDEAAAGEALRVLMTKDWFHALELSVGLACTVLGAFAGARRAGLLHIRHGGWIAVGSTAVVALLSVLAPPPSSSTRYRSGGKPWVGF